jgi:hypothetical protein
MELIEYEEELARVRFLRGRGFVVVRAFVALRGLAVALSPCAASSHGFFAGASSHKEQSP